MVIPRIERQASTAVHRHCIYEGGRSVHLKTTTPQFHCHCICFPEHCRRHVKRVGVPDIAKVVDRLNERLSSGEPYGMCDSRDPDVFEEDGAGDSHQCHNGR